MTRTVLIVTVGGSDAPVVHAIQQNRPVAFVYFICSTGDGPAASDRTVREALPQPLKQQCPKCGKAFQVPRTTGPIAEKAGLGGEGDDFAIERVTDPDDLIGAVEAAKRIDADIAARFAAEPVRVVANYTGGTKTMSVGLALYALRAAGRWELQLNAAGRQDLVKITAGDIALPQDAAALHAEDALAAAERLMAKHDPAGATETLDFTLSRLRVSSPLRTRLTRYRTRCAVQAAWDRFDHESALDEAQSDTELEAELGRELRLLRRCSERFLSLDRWHPRDEAGYQLVLDIIRNAERCSGRARYDDAAARLYRATELLAQIRLRRDHDVRTVDVDVGAALIPDATRAWLEKHRGRGGRVAIGLFPAYQLLHDLGDPLGAYFHEHEAAMHGFVEVRNASILAHGLTPVDEATWRSKGERWRAWLDEALAVVAEGRNPRPTSKSRP